MGYIIVDKILEGNIDYILDATNNKNNGDIIDYFNGPILYTLESSRVSTINRYYFKSKNTLF